MRAHHRYEYAPARYPVARPEPAQRTAGALCLCTHTLALEGACEGGRRKNSLAAISQRISPIPPVEKSRNAASHRSRNFRSA
eukprot:scaffold4216_cov145-Isochrysis_galbana.AAC.7